MMRILYKCLYSFFIFSSIAEAVVFQCGLNTNNVCNGVAKPADGVAPTLQIDFHNNNVRINATMGWEHVSYYDKISFVDILTGSLLCTTGASTTALGQYWSSQQFLVSGNQCLKQLIISNPIDTFDTVCGFDKVVTADTATYSGHILWERTSCNNGRIFATSNYLFSVSWSLSGTGSFSQTVSGNGNVVIPDLGGSEFVTISLYPNKDSNVPITGTIHSKDLVNVDVFGITSLTGVTNLLRIKQFEIRDNLGVVLYTIVDNGLLTNDAYGLGFANTTQTSVRTGPIRETFNLYIPPCPNNAGSCSLVLWTQVHFSSPTTNRLLSADDSSLRDGFVTIQVETKQPAQLKTWMITTSSVAGSVLIFASMYKATLYVKSKLIR